MLCASSGTSHALKQMGSEVRRWQINLRATSDIGELAEWMDPVIRG